jgi:ABC-type multidrug transport system permease subunit
MKRIGFLVVLPLLLSLLVSCDGETTVSSTIISPKEEVFDLTLSKEVQKLSLELEKTYSEKMLNLREGDTLLIVFTHYSSKTFLPLNIVKKERKEVVYRDSNMLCLSEAINTETPVDMFWFFTIGSIFILLCCFLEWILDSETWVYFILSSGTLGLFSVVILSVHIFGGYFFLWGLSFLTISIVLGSLINKQKE